MAEGRPARIIRVGLPPSSPIPIRCCQGIADHALICQLQSCLPIARGEKCTGRYAPASCALACSPPLRHATKILQPCLAGRYHNHPLPRQVLFAPGRAGGEHFATRLRPYGYPVCDQVALHLLQRSILFIVHRQVQMITLLISDQPPLAFQVSGNPLASRCYQPVELFGRGGVGLVKSQFSIALERKDAINKQRMKMQVRPQQPQPRWKWLQRRDEKLRAKREVKKRLVIRSAAAGW